MAEELNTNFDKQKKISMAEFLERARLIGVELDIERPPDYPRDIDFGSDEEAKIEPDKK